MLKKNVMTRAMPLFFLLLFASNLNAQVVIDSATTHLTDFDVAYFVDTTRNQELHAIIHEDFQASRNRLSLGTNAKTTWLRLCVKNKREHATTLYLHMPEAYHTERLSLFQVAYGEVIQQHHINLSKNQHSPLMFGAAAVFPLHFAPHSTSEVYLKSDVFSHQWFTLALFDELNSKYALVSENYDIAIMVGMLLALMVYNLLLFVSSRRKENILYALYLISGTLWIALSYGFLATLFGWYGESVMRLHLSLLAMPSFLILFMMTIFDTKRLYRKEHIALSAVLVLLIADLIFGIFDIIGALKPASTLAAIMIVVTLSVSLSILRKGNPLAKYFLLGHGLFFTFNLFAIGYYKGLLANNYITSHGVGIGILLESCMLAFIISYRIRILERIKEQQNELQLQANTDPLTHLYNRRYFDQAVNALLDPNALALPVTIVIADIDHFKQFNDQYGHQTGDEVLVSFAEILQSASPEDAIVARLGGEEFIIALPNTDSHHALKITEALRSKVANTVITSQGHNTLSITASFGVCQVTERLKDTIINADKALYHAKATGRNRVSCFNSEIQAQQSLESSMV